MAFNLFPDAPVYAKPTPALTPEPAPAPTEARSVLLGVFPASPSYQPPTTQASVPAPGNWVRISLQVPGALALDGAVSEEFARAVGKELGRVTAMVADALGACVAPEPHPAGKESEEHAREEWE
jgi:hypothetical protein